MKTIGLPFLMGAVGLALHLTAGHGLYLPLGISLHLGENSGNIFLGQSVHTAGTDSAYESGRQHQSG